MKSWNVTSKGLTPEDFHYASTSIPITEPKLRRRTEKKTIHCVTVKEAEWKALNPFFSINETGTKFFPRNCHIASGDITVPCCVTVQAESPFTGTQRRICGTIPNVIETEKLWFN